MNFGSRFTLRYIAAIRWFIPLEVRENAATLTRAQNVINAVVMAALSGPFYAWVYAALGYGAAARVILTCCAGMFVAPFLMRATKSIVVGREVFLCAVFFNFSWLTYAMGGVGAPTAGWMVIPPMVAMFLGGFATAMFWLGLTCATIALIYALPLLGIPLPAHPIEDMALLHVLCDVGLYIVIVLFVLLFELTKTQGFIQLQHALDFLHELATRDALTGGHKRRRLLALADEERKDFGHGSAGFSLCLLEIDGIRRINASHGHAAGDLVLHEVALCVKAALRDGDAFGRYGGAQLLVLLPGATQEEALVLAERVRHAVEQLRFTGIVPAPTVTVSVGVAAFRAGESIGQTMARADEALAQAASNTGNRVVAYGQAPQASAPAADETVPDLVDATRVDALTGLLSRRVLRGRLGHAMARALRNGRPVALMLLNLNKLKDINDAFGIAGGDTVLAQAAAQVRACLHVADTIVRASGDEFIVILEDLDGAAAAQHVAERILDHFAFPLLVAERECALNLSIGIAIFPAPGCDMDALLERARIAMTRARNWGGNHVQLYAPDTALAPDGRLALKNDLRNALGAHQLRLAYRPRVDLASGQLAGVETLVHWVHPVHGRLEAARFMTLAEETSLVLPIGEWVLRSACRQNATWRAAGLAPLRTAVALSARQLAHPGMAESILAIVRETGIEPHCLEVQVLETALADALPLHAALLGTLRRAGVRIAIGGFGLGGPGLRLLAGLPVDTLKLERSFIGPLGQDERASALAQSIVDLAHRLHIAVIANAVETEAQLAALRAMGCDAAQGDYVAHPAAAAGIAQLFHQLSTCPTP
ncbi:MULTISPECIES: bifunctional diguanylate cyclase/phosphodiesterase [unclassified Massilia]|uniref:putative bifunctional diguanylate cyclase/phosphodiesterase n=1 Tax=unclassified Massilia TaxID=2609279 RepID=UPI00178507C4|nr:bifunctional diguanylate cyclase/phosphodiesterase [Massilia sp. CFBP 13647]MBD8673460.1 bifunctional diguanylate cyclase/phosphodiesterase [Massilia sp. CFBP 13721]